MPGPNNKSSHFHCLKCNFICSDTNKVVAHRRQHSKLEFIRMAGFRKVANNEKCTIGCGKIDENLLSENFHNTNTNSNDNDSLLQQNDELNDRKLQLHHQHNHSHQQELIDNNSSSSSNGNGNSGENKLTPPGECCYSLKQTHYHCLVCDCSVLSRAQLSSHRHRV